MGPTAATTSSPAVLLFWKAFALLTVMVTSIFGPLWEENIATGTDKTFSSVWKQASTCIPRVTDLHAFTPTEPLTCMRAYSNDPLVAPFDGIWWMDGNPANEELASFAEGWVDVDGYLWLPINPKGNGGTWAYAGYPRWYWYSLANMIVQCTMEVLTGFVLSPDGTELRAAYDYLNSANESYDFVDVHTYTKTFSHGLVYNLRRIIGPDGQPTHNWANYAAYLQEEGIDTMHVYKRGGCSADF